MSSPKLVPCVESTVFKPIMNSLFPQKRAAPREYVAFFVKEVVGTHFSAQDFFKLIAQLDAASLKQRLSSMGL